MFETPEARKERRKANRDRLKAKMKEEVKGMTKVQALEFIEGKKEDKLVQK